MMHLIIRCARTSRLALVIHSFALSGALLLSACSSSDSSSVPTAPAADAGPGTTAAASTAGNADTPATGTEAEVNAWLGLAEYTKGKWKCETAPHAARSPSPHGTNRICSNVTTSAHGAGEFPVGSAAVKELYDSAGTAVVGHAVYVKMKAGGGESFYWFESTKADGVVANGVGERGAARTICVGCHDGAGSDANHSGHDEVYTQVK